MTPGKWAAQRVAAGPVSTSRPVAMTPSPVHPTNVAGPSAVRTARRERIGLIGMLDRR
jgi:hypothetical protein